MLAQEETPTSPMYFTQSFRGSGNNFYYLGILRIESREKKNEDRARYGRGPSTEYTVEDSSREQRGRGLDSSCTVNNTPPGRDRLAHPRHPATIYLLFVPNTFVSWPPLPSMVAGGVYRRGNWRRNPRASFSSFIHVREVASPSNARWGIKSFGRRQERKI